LCVLCCHVSNYNLYFPDLDLGLTLKTLLDHALRPNTKRTYSSAQNRFLRFCLLYDFEPCPVTEDVLLYYISYLFKDHLKGSTIRVYISAIRNLHVSNGVSFIGYTPKIAMALKGANVLSDPPSRKEPITFSILSALIPLLSGRCDAIMMEAVFSLAFFGCLRCGEFCVTDSAPFDPSVHPCIGDVLLLPVKEKMFSLLLKVSKTDAFNAGVKVYVGCSGAAICAYCSMKRYLASRGHLEISQPLFVDPNGNVLRRRYFVSTVKLLLSFLSLDPSRFSGHSFRAGAATSGAQIGMDNWEIKMLGRWSSEAYNVYIRNPKIAAKFAKRLASDVVPNVK
jgi:hypothetical protein